MTTRRPSKAEIRRRIREQQASRSAPPPALAPHIADYVATYVPRTVDAEVWDTVRPFVLDVLARYEPEALESARLRLGALVVFANWALERGYPLERDELLDLEMVEAFADTVDGSRNTVANYRSRLRGVVRKVRDGGAGLPVSVPIPHQAVKAPYTPQEVAQIVRITRTQPNETTARQLRACVGLGLGAGLDSPDLRHLRGRHVRRLDGDEGVRVEVVEGRQRIVWVLREFEELVLSGLPSQASRLVVGEAASRRNIAANVFKRAHILGDAPHFEQSRMRTTWLARLLSAGIPLPVIMQAAGLTSARTLTDLVPFVEHDPATAATALRGER